MLDKTVKCDYNIICSLVITANENNQICSRGGIGIRARLRIQSGFTGYGFKSRRLHCARVAQW